MSSENPIWTLPEGREYAVEMWIGNEWKRREEYSTIKAMKDMAQAIQQVPILRVVRVSRYPPHPAQAVVYYLERD
jgi:hypothetical protein